MLAIATENKARECTEMVAASTFVVSLASKTLQECGVMCKQANVPRAVLVDTSTVGMDVAFLRCITPEREYK